MEFLYDILLDNGFKYKARGDESLSLKNGDYCIIRKDFFLDYGQIIAVSHTPLDRKSVV